MSFKLKVDDIDIVLSFFPPRVLTDVLQKIFTAQVQIVVT